MPQTKEPGIPADVGSPKVRRAFVDVAFDFANLKRDFDALRTYIDRGASAKHIDAALLATMLAVGMLQQRLLQMAYTAAAEKLPGTRC